MNKTQRQQLLLEANSTLHFKRPIKCNSETEAKSLFKSLVEEQKGLSNKIEWKTPIPEVYDGSWNFQKRSEPFMFDSPRYVMGYDPYREFIPIKKPKFRIPRKLKKYVKTSFNNIRLEKRQMRFYLDCYKTSRHFGCKILKERSTL